MLKIRIRESTDAQYKHLIVKSLIALAIRIKYKHTLKHQKIYSEFPIAKGRITDIYHENSKEKSVVCYEVQQIISKEWFESTKRIYDTYKVYQMNVDWVLVDLKKLDNDITKMWKQIRELII